MFFMFFFDVSSLGQNALCDDMLHLQETAEITARTDSPVLDTEIHRLKTKKLQHWLVFLKTGKNIDLLYL